MKPVLITQDFQGQNSANYSYTVEKLTKAALWKRQRIAVVIPAGQSIPALVYLNHMNLMFPLNNQMRWILAQGMEVAAAYQAAFEEIVNDQELCQWEYILTLEHDNTPPADGLLKLIGHMDQHPEFSAISGLYFSKGPEGVAQIWGDMNDPMPNLRPQPPDPKEGLKECRAIGMGFTLFRMNMFRDGRIPKPWFATVRDQYEAYTQDIFFWMNAVKYGYRCAVACDVRVGHYDEKANKIW
jgi:GT2 family glycosyltransferase